MKTAARRRNWKARLRKGCSESKRRITVRVSWHADQPSARERCAALSISRSRRTMAPATESSKRRASHWLSQSQISPQICSPTKVTSARIVSLSCTSGGAFITCNGGRALSSRARRRDVEMPRGTRGGGGDCWARRVSRCVSGALSLRLLSALTERDSFDPILDAGLSQAPFRETVKKCGNLDLLGAPSFLADKHAPNALSLRHFERVRASASDSLRDALDAFWTFYVAPAGVRARGKTNRRFGLALPDARVPHVRSVPARARFFCSGTHAHAMNMS